MRARHPEPIFTPTTKAPVGEHDEPMTFDDVRESVGPDIAEELRRITVEIYTSGAELARERGIIVADTKIELGWSAEGVLTLGEEVLTPDSSRFWPLENGSPAPPPPLPPHVVEVTRQKYAEAYELLTGRVIPPRRCGPNH